MSVRLGVLDAATLKNPREQAPGYSCALHHHPLQGLSHPTVEKKAPPSQKKASLGEAKKKHYEELGSSFEVCKKMG